MAYIAFGAEAALAGEAAPALTASFTAAEWAAIRLARIDGPATLRTAGPVRRLIARLFGVAPANRLADPRLEALRQAAVRCRHGAQAIAASEIERLLGHGFRFDQVALLAASARV